MVLINSGSGNEICGPNRNSKGVDMRVPGQTVADQHSIPPFFHALPPIQGEHEGGHPVGIGAVGIVELMSGQNEPHRVERIG